MAVILEGVVFMFRCSVYGKKLRGRWGVMTVPSDEGGSDICRVDDSRNR